MYAVTLPSEHRHLSTAQISGPGSGPGQGGMHGEVRVAFAAEAPGGGLGGARLKDLYQTPPMRVLFPGRTPGELFSAALVTTSGGLTGGDRLDIHVGTDTGAAVQVIGQAAEKIYRSTGADTVVNVDLQIGADSWLEWLPQESIVFDRARLRRTTRVDVQTGGSFLGAEMLIFGRTAMGERLTEGLIRDVWEVRRSGKLVWADALHLAGDLQTPLDHPAGLDGARAVATCVFVADDAARHLDLARDVLDEGPDGVKCAATVSNGVLLARWMAVDAQALRKALAEYWGALRHELNDLPRAMPRLWHM